MEKYYKLNFENGKDLIVKDYRSFPSLKTGLDRFTLFLTSSGKQVLVNTASITYIEEVEVNG